MFWIFFYNNSICFGLRESNVLSNKTWLHYPTRHCYIFSKLKTLKNGNKQLKKVLYGEHKYVSQLSLGERCLVNGGLDDEVLPVLKEFMLQNS